MKSTTSPAVAMLVGTLVLSQLGAGSNSAQVPGAKTTPATIAGPAAVNDIADSLSGMLAKMGPMAQEGILDLLKGLDGKKAPKPPAAAKQQAQAVPVPPPQPRHIRMRMPPPPPPKTAEEQAKVDAQRAMYERIKAMNEEDRAAE